MFYGESTVAIDDKGRLAIPTAYREQLSALCACRLVITYNPFERECLWLFPLPEWERTRDQVMQLSSFNAAHRDLQRKLVGAAAQVELDGNGRILLPQTARQVAALQKHGILLGIGAKFELWSETAQRARLELPIDEKDISDDMRQLRF
ncbi:MAG: division/cell wall cluster transcriptional repressor MraZ [Lysobacterales bacterium]|nr:division/cell wall cluster transcriptional repressor MraZ [Xanthomonadales bacterium]MCB1611211.1 division/cell wall cluster transcriptional repressor MraZ [Xanthomonadales bacterium]MCP5476749.1 division/cell wall cluster transcriptional repressor MraZ [Rhodanobacteraceae bacterium]